MSPSFLLTKTDRLLRRSSIFISLFLFVILLSRPFDSVAQIKLAWDPNTEPDLAGYRVYYGTASRNYRYSIDVGNVTTCTLPGLTQGVTYYIVITAYDSAKNESAYSNEVSGRVTEIVRAPTVLSGPTSGVTGDAYTFRTGGSSSTLGHAVQYQFDWKGDGSDLSAWGAAAQSRTWAVAGTYNVRVRARCVNHTNVISPWFSSLTVNITRADFSTITFLAPKGGEVLSSGASYTIQWEAPPQAVKFKIRYSLNSGGTWKTISDDITRTRYTWLVPTPTTNRKNCFLKIIGYDAAGKRIGKAKSETPFAIEEMKLTSPNGTETLVSGGNYRISWRANKTRNPVSSFKLFYTEDKGRTWTLITSVAGNPRIYLWAIPTVEKKKTKCKVKVVLRDANGRTMGSDVSDDYFTIQP